MSDSWYRFFIERSWTLSVQRVAETNKSISQLHQDEMDQWNALVEEENPISNRSWNLVPELLGFTADHGARRKSVNPDSTEKRCGECPLSLCKQLSAAGHAFFLDWEYLLGAVEVTISNWTKLRYKSRPKHLDTCTVPILSYDNLHNFVGHIRDLYQLLSQDLPSEMRKGIEKQMVTLAGVPYREKEPFGRFKGYQWRKCSLSFYNLFAGTFRTKEAKAGFKVM